MRWVQNQNKKKIYQLLFFVISILFIWFFVRHFGQVQNAVETLAHASWYFMIALAGLLVLSIINRGAFYHSLYDFFGARDSLKRLITLSLASAFVGLAAPSGGLSGAAVFISEAEKQGMNKTKSTFVYLFSQFLIYSVFLLILLFGLFYLLFNHQLQKYQIITAAVLFGIIFFFIFSMFVALESAAKLKKLFQFVSAAINYLARLLSRRGDLISGEDVHLVSQEIRNSLELVERNFKHLWLPILHVFLMEAIDILILYYVILAFGYQVYPGVLITVYAVGVLFTLISITPSGVGVVEATMIVVLTNLKVPVELATISVVGYRIFTFWIPFILGYFAFRVYNNDKILRLEDSNGSH